MVRKRKNYTGVRQGKVRNGRKVGVRERKRRKVGEEDKGRIG